MDLAAVATSLPFWSWDVMLLPGWLLNCSMIHVVVSFYSQVKLPTHEYCILIGHISVGYPGFLRCVCTFCGDLNALCWEHNAMLGGSGGMPPRNFSFQGCNLVQSGAIWALKLHSNMVPKFKENNWYWIVKKKKNHAPWGILAIL